MAKYMVKGTYTPAGAQGLIKEGGSGRRAAVEKALTALGGKLEAVYYALGEDDVYVVCEIPDVTSALALSLAVNAAGAVRISTIPLVSIEEIDAAAKKTVGYRAPGA